MIPTKRRIRGNRGLPAELKDDVMNLFEVPAYLRCH
jgi:hypothetical protein